MPKKFLICMSYFLICASPALPAGRCVYAADETLTITTYYPSPYGSYREVSAYQMKIGKDYSDASYSVNENNLIVQGNVGIGTASPAAQLHVAGAVDIRGSHPSWQAGTDSLAIDITTGAGGLARYNHQPSAGGHTFFVAGGEKVRITSAGNLGIGTASPAQLLDVAGNMQANLYYDKDNTAYYVNPNATSNVYRMYVNYTPTANNDVATKGYVDTQVEAAMPRGWTCTLVEQASSGGGGGYYVTATCSGDYKLITGGCRRDPSGGGWTGAPTNNGYSCYSTDYTQFFARAWCCR